jgi:long-subunit acyl-CoA synthetase (AMP-forming)
MTETASQVASQTTEGGEMEVLPIWDLSTDDDGVLTVRGEAFAKGYAMQENGKMALGGRSQPKRACALEIA